MQFGRQFFHSRNSGSLRVFLEEQFSLDAIRCAHERERSVMQIWQGPFCKPALSRTNWMKPSSRLPANAPNPCANGV